jgi:hypothetical protein
MILTESDATFLLFVVVFVWCWAYGKGRSDGRNDG